MITTQVWFNGYDITSSLTETDILDGTGIIVMVTLHISLGIYAQRLSRRLCLQPRIFEMMELKLTTGVKVSNCIGFRNHAILISDRTIVMNSVHFLMF